MSAPVDSSVIEVLLSKQNYLDDLAESLQSPNYRTSIDLNNFTEISNTVNQATQVLQAIISRKNSELLLILTASFRCLRNACAGCLRNQLNIPENENLLWNTKHILLTLLNDRDEVNKALGYTKAKVQCMACAVQFFGNLITSCPHNHQCVIHLLWDIFNDLLKCGHNNVANYTCMVLYNCLSDDLQSRLISTKDGRQISASALNLIAEHEDAQWGLLLCKVLLTFPSAVNQLYSDVGYIEKLVILDILLETIDTDGGGKKEERNVPPSVLEYFGTTFVENANSLLKLCEQDKSSDVEPGAISRLLRLLCTATSLAEYRSLLNMNSLLECAISLLRVIHLLGKSHNNPFAAANVEVTGSDDMHPAFGLRRDLVRLVGNMCYRHSDNQNLARELGAVPLLLDQSSIDHQNPYITQWAVLAVRNLCENNTENQTLIAEMKLQGVSNSVEMLRTYGIDAYEQDGKIIIRKAHTT